MSRYFKQMLSDLGKYRFIISVVMLIIFIMFTAGIMLSLVFEVPLETNWKDILLVLATGFVTEYGKAMNFWYNNQERDEKLIKEADEEDEQRR